MYCTIHSLAVKLSHQICRRLALRISITRGLLGEIALTLLGCKLNMPQSCVIMGLKWIELRILRDIDPITFIIGHPINYYDYLI